MLNQFYFLYVRKLFGLNIHIGGGKFNAVRGSIYNVFKVLFLSRRRRLRLIDLFIRRTTCVFHVIQLGLVNSKVSKIFFLKNLCAFLKGLQFKESLCLFFFGILKLFRKFAVHFTMVIEFMRKLKLNYSCNISLLFLKGLLMQLLS